MDDEKISLQDDLLALCLDAMNSLSPDKITPEIDMAIAKVEKYIGHTVEKKKKEKEQKKFNPRNLPPHILQKILFFLPKEDILSFALVCREWSPAALTYLLRQHPFRSDKELLWFIVSRSNSDTFISKQYQGLLTELDLTAAHSLYYDLGVMGTVECQYENPLTSLLDLQLEALAKGSNLYCLKFDNIPLSTLVRVVANCPKLRILHANKIHRITTKEAHYLSSLHLALTELKIGFCLRNLQINADEWWWCNSSESLEQFTAEFFISIGKTLRVLRITDGVELTGNVVKAITRGCLDLEFLDLSKAGLTFLDNEELIRLFMGLKNLKTIWIRPTELKIVGLAIAELTKNTPGLEHIWFEGESRHSAEAFRAIVNNCKNLRTLLIRRILRSINMNDITDGLEKLNKLEAIDLETIATDELVERITKSCPNLRQLNIGNSDNVTDNVIEKIYANCNKLECIGLSGCKHITQKSFDYLSTMMPQVRVVSSPVEYTSTQWMYAINSQNIDQYRNEQLYSGFSSKVIKYDSRHFKFYMNTESSNYALSTALLK